MFKFASNGQQPRTQPGPMHNKAIQRRHLPLCFVVLSALPMSGAPYALAGQPGKGHAVRADVVRPTIRAMVREMKMPATLAADELVDLYAKVSGYVGSIDVDIGSLAKKGDILVTLNIPEMMDEIRQAEAVVNAGQAKVRALRAMETYAGRSVETARAQVKRYAARRDLDAINSKRKEELRKGNAIPQQALDEARSALAVSQARLDIAKAQVAGAEAQLQAARADVEVGRSDAAVGEANLSRLRTLMEYSAVRAPFDGVITKRIVDHGAFVRSAAEGTTMPLLQIAKIDRIRVVLEIPESDAPFVYPGTPVRIDVKALKREPIVAKVSRIAGALNPETRTLRAEVDLDNEEYKLTPGMYAQVVVELEIRAQATMIPSKAIRVQGKDTVVYVVSDGVARSLQVKIGYDDGIWAEVLSGLTGDEQVITAASGVVTLGTAVKMITSDS